MWLAAPFAPYNRGDPMMKPKHLLASVTCLLGLLVFLGGGCGGRAQLDLGDDGGPTGDGSLADSGDGSPGVDGNPGGDGGGDSSSSDAADGSTCQSPDSICGG